MIATRRVGCNHLITNKQRVESGISKNAYKIMDKYSLYYFAQQKTRCLLIFPEHGILNSSYTMMAKPIKTLELHYPMI